VLIFICFSNLMGGVFGDGNYDSEEEKLNARGKKKGDGYKGALGLKMKTASLRVFEAWFSPEM